MLKKTDNLFQQGFPSLLMMATQRWMGALIGNIMRTRWKDAGNCSRPVPTSSNMINWSFSSFHHTFQLCQSGPRWSTDQGHDDNHHHFIFLHYHCNSIDQLTICRDTVIGMSMPAPISGSCDGKLVRKTNQIEAGEGDIKLRVGSDGQLGRRCDLPLPPGFSKVSRCFWSEPTPLYGHSLMCRHM